jgi:hypothetical protein
MAFHPIEKTYRLISSRSIYPLLTKAVREGSSWTGIFKEHLSTFIANNTKTLTEYGVNILHPENTFYFKIDRARGSVLALLRVKEEKFIRSPLFNDLISTLIEPLTSALKIGEKIEVEFFEPWVAAKFAEELCPKGFSINRAEITGNNFVLNQLRSTKGRNFLRNTKPNNGYIRILEAFLEVTKKMDQERTNIDPLIEETDFALTFLEVSVKLNYLTSFPLDAGSIKITFQKEAPA